MSCEQKTKISTDHEDTHHFLYDQSTTKTSIKGICKSWKGKEALPLPPLPRRALAPDTQWTDTAKG